MSASKDAYYGDRNRRPSRPKFYGKELPKSLRELPTWIGWRFAWRDSDKKWSKLPLDPNKGCRRTAKTNDPKTWATLPDTINAMCEAASDPDDIDGIGFVFDESHGLFGLDIDGCRNPETGELSELATRLLAQFGTYAEISPSGMGVKLIGRGTFEGSGRKINLDDGQDLELYRKGRYFTLTGWRVGDGQEVADCAGALERFIEEFKLEVVEKGLRDEGDKTERNGKPSRNGHVLTDDEVLYKLFHVEREGEKWQRLWAGDTSDYDGDDNKADHGLCSKIAFYFDYDESMTEGLFRQSGLMRPKWDEMRGDKTYGVGTVAKLCAGKRGTGYGSGKKKGKGKNKGKIKDDKDDAKKKVSSLEIVLGKDGDIALTDMGNAERLLKNHGENLKRVGKIGAWFIWDGKRWVEDETEEIDHLMKRTIRSIHLEVKKDEDTDKSNKILQHAISSEAKSAVKAAVELAKSDPKVAVKLEEFNSNPMVMNCKNGILNLANGELREHSRTDMMTGICPTNYDPDATCPQWGRTLGLIFPVDPRNPEAGAEQPMITYIQRLFGLCLTGLVDEAILPIFWGGGANGKSTILNAVRAVMGDSYAIQAPRDFLMQKQNDNHPTELTDLHHRRLVIASETRKSRKLDESLVKWLTGGERIRARRMRQDFYEFDPTHKLILCTNHKPRVTDDDDGIWRRVVLIEFAVKFWNPDKKGVKPGLDCLMQNKKLPRQLLKEAPGILAWMVRGCLDYQAEGLEMPASVETKTNEYRAQEDVVEQYLKDRIIVHVEKVKGEKLPQEKYPSVYRDYCEWCEATGCYMMPSPSFKSELLNRGYQVKIGANNYTWCKGFGFNKGQSEEKKKDNPLTLEDFND